MKKSKRKISCAKMVQSQGFGTRREIVKGVYEGRLRIKGERVENPNTLVELENLEFEWDKKLYHHQEKVLIVMHKKVGEECSHQPQHHTSVFERLPKHIVKRGVECIGRLDVETSGVLLFTDDGEYNHQVCSPKSKLPKTYHLRCEDPLEESISQLLLDGVELRKEKKVFKALSADLNSDGSLTLTISEGKYHQVRRMLGALGHKVNYLHRSHVGPWTCDGLKPGEYKEIPLGEWDESRK